MTVSPFRPRQSPHAARYIRFRCSGVGVPLRSFPLLILLLAVAASAPACDEGVRDGRAADAGDLGDAALFDGLWDPDGGRLVVDPSIVEFPVEWLDEPAEQTVTLRNVGTRSLVVFGLELVGEGAEAIAEDSPALPLALAAGESASLRLTYVPSTCESLAAVLRIRSSDPTAAILDVPLTSNSLTAELSASPDLVAFGRVGAGVTASRELTVTNRGHCPLRLDDIAIEGSGSFGWTASIDGSAGDADLPVLVEHGLPFVLAVTYRSARDIPESGLLRLVAEGGDQVVEIPLSANQRECPVAVAQGTIEGSGDPPTDSLVAIPLETVRLDAGESYDPDRRVVAYDWRVVVRPEDSTARLDPSPTVSDPTFFLDLAGEYAFELTVVDDDGLPSCNTDSVRVVAVPDEDLHVQLVWHTPADGNETDMDGTDLDLHLLRLPGTWDTEPWDCHWKNVSPNWGDVEASDDNPSLDIDDVDGTGPENINLDHPEAGRIYAIGVYYYGDRGMGASRATVRVYLDGLLVFEAADRELARTDVFWDVGRITWPAAGVESVDRIYETGFP